MVKRSFLGIIIALSFVCSFTDQNHHYKEDLILFAFRANKQNGEIDAAIEKLRSQHDHSRNLLSSIFQALNGYYLGSNESTLLLNFNLTQYREELAKRIHVEDKIFYPLVEATIFETEHEALIEEFQKIETRDNQGTRDAYIGQIEQMKACSQPLSR